MKLTEPKIDERPEQPYVGIRNQVTLAEMGAGLIPQLIGEVFGWLGQHDIEPAGPPFLRFHVINMDGKMDVELGIPTASTVAGDGRVRAGSLPAGRYASLIYTGIANGIPANKELIDWATEQGLVWDTYEDPGGDGFVSRYEIYMDGPEEHPDPAEWRTEVAIRLADA